MTTMNERPEATGEEMAGGAQATARRTPGDARALVERAARAYVAAHWDDVVDDIRTLVRVESTEDLPHATDQAPFGPGPRAAMDAALEVAARLGFATTHVEGAMGCADLPSARAEAAGASDDPADQLGIIGHVDVVPAGPGWSVPAYDVTHREGYLMGRGVCDDKGPLVVAMHAACVVRDALGALPRGVRVLVGTNEETGMADVERYRARVADPWFLFTPDAEFPVGYGEAGIMHGWVTSAPLAQDAAPAGQALISIEGGAAVNAVPGVACAVVRAAEAPHAAEGIAVSPQDAGRYLLEAQGRAAHASTPELGQSALAHLLAYILDQGLCAPEQRPFLEFQRRLACDHTGAAVGIDASDDDFGALTCVAGLARTEGGRILQSVDCRYPTSTSGVRLAEAISAGADRAGASFRLDDDRPPFLMEADSPEVRALADAYSQVTDARSEPFTMKGGTYARHFARGVSFGPEEPHVPRPAWVGSIHGPDEGIAEELLQRSLVVYALAIAALVELPAE
ncbi:Sapep family Mn(2+)-dependent dipeptidase [Eggerthellaceae bacterium zg-1084]|uniref:Sapep family Mn(2+)-dependent dipeptidase n=1 Tax=Berryella wangjianweii TaxID=2734634 RepID=UPI001552C2A8|nr:Sapep family Mn(2+)-dependent dipeptidase [Berryella wangjianweii]NPD31088.1 Sapep family Mn(2+)-dependent dipeptidase [Berryella wangjianweii]NPD31950.1 Sapep family Mn(2+)-dependent dipeptidase [Eggerthellaceae bacterium zg-997]